MGISELVVLAIVDLVPIVGLVAFICWIGARQRRIVQLNEDSKRLLLMILETLRSQKA